MKKIAVFAVGLFLMVGGAIYYAHAISQEFECINISMYELRMEYINILELPASSTWQEIFAAMEKAPDSARQEMAHTVSKDEDVDWDQIHLLKLEGIRRQLARAIGVPETASWDEIDAVRKVRAELLNLPAIATWQEIFAARDACEKEKIALALGAKIGASWDELFKIFAIKDNQELLAKPIRTAEDGDASGDTPIEAPGSDDEAADPGVAVESDDDSTSDHSVRLRP